MGKTILRLAIILISTTMFSQKTIDRLTFSDARNIDVFKSIKNNTQVTTYVAQDGAVLKVGDTLMIGTPSSSSTTHSANRSTGAYSTTRSQFQTIQVGRPAGFSSVLAAMNGEPPIMAGISLQEEIVIIREIKVVHKGSKKKPLLIVMILGEQNDRAFGANKYLSTSSYEKSVLLGELRSVNSPMTRDQAISKLKESKNLLDLEMMTQEEYDMVKVELAPIIKGEK